MKFKITKDELSKGISKVISTINQRSTLPVLLNILFETVDNNKIKITGTDLEVGVFNIIEGVIFEEGSITIPAKKISDIVREAPEQEIEISVSKSNSISIKSGKAFFKLMGLPKDDYPKFPNYSLEKAITLKQNILRDCINLTSFAISTDETRYILNGALLVVEANNLKMITTDGRRLAIMEKTLENNVEKMEAIIPTKAINELSKNLDASGDVKVVDIGNQIIFEIGNTTIVSRLIEGHFPNFEQVIPKDINVVAKIDRRNLLSSIRRVSLLTSLEAQAIKIDLTKNSTLILSSRCPNVGESKEELDVSYSGEKEITVGFNPLFIMDVLKSLDIDVIDFYLIDEDKPGMVKGKEGYTYVIMPMQIG